MFAESTLNDSNLTIYLDKLSSQTVIPDPLTAIGSSCRHKKRLCFYSLFIFPKDEQSLVNPKWV
jgi:hypothetical protein